MNYVLATFLPPIIATIICIIGWHFAGKDAKGREIIVPMYEPPTDLTPAEVGVLHDFEATDREVTATIIDLAMRGYIHIIKRKKEAFLGSYHMYEFELANDNVLSLRRHEKAILNGMFGVVGAKFTQAMQAKITNPAARLRAQKQYPSGTVSLVGTRVTLQSIKPYFFSHVVQAKKDLYNDLTHKGYFKNNPLLSGTNHLFLALISFLIAVIFLKDFFYTWLVTGMIFMLFAKATPARSKLGKQAKEVVDGFLLFLTHTDADNIVAQQSPQSVQTVNEKVAFYEKYVGYAVALGLEKQWTSKFKKAYTNEAIHADVQEIVASVLALMQHHKSGEAPN